MYVSRVFEVSIALFRRVSRIVAVGESVVRVVVFVKMVM